MMNDCTVALKLHPLEFGLPKLPHLEGGGVHFQWWWWWGVVILSKCELRTGGWWHAWWTSRVSDDMWVLVKLKLFYFILVYRNVQTILYFWLLKRCPYYIVVLYI